MYRRPKSLEVILAIRSAMSAEAGYDIATLFEMVRTGVRPPNNSRTVTRVEGELNEDVHAKAVAEPSRVEISDE